MQEIIKKVASRYLEKMHRESLGRKKTAGEVRFVKDNSNDASQWAYSIHGPSQRQIGQDYQFSAKKMRDIMRILRSTNASLGHIMSAYTMFAKLKSSEISPDGALGGKGYIQKIADMRRQFMNIVEATSAISDTLYDEINAPHWAIISRKIDPSDQKEVKDIMKDVEMIKGDPEAWAKHEEEEFDQERKERT